MFNVVKLTTYYNDDCTGGETANAYTDFGDISPAEVCPDETQCILGIKCSSENVDLASLSFEGTSGRTI